MALKIYKLDPAAASTFDGNDLTNLTSWTWEESSEETSLSSDGNTHIQAVFVDNIASTITVSGYDVSSTIRNGDCGALVLKTVQKSDCTVTTPDTITYTFANATCLSVSRTVNHQGQSEFTATFKAYKPEGTDVVVIS